MSSVVAAEPRVGASARRAMTQGDARLNLIIALVELDKFPGAITRSDPASAARVLPIVRCSSGRKIMIVEGEAIVPRTSVSRLASRLALQPGASELPLFSDGLQELFVPAH